MQYPTEGRALFEAFIARNKVSQHDAAKALAVSSPCVSDWIRGKKRPDAVQRAAIDLWTGGDVPECSWLLPDERTKIAGVVPFVRDEAGGSGG